MKTVEQFAKEKDITLSAVYYLIKTNQLDFEKFGNKAYMIKETKRNKEYKRRKK